MTAKSESTMLIVDNETGVRALVNAIERERTTPWCRVAVVADRGAAQADSAPADPACLSGVPIGFSAGESVVVRLT